jgi:formamidopyrimidine-DNA glycosylase
VPELPEVETVVRDLRTALSGRTFRAVRRTTRKGLRKAWSAAWEQSLAGRTVAALSRRGKWIIVELDDGGRLVLHLGMSGQLTVVDAAEPMADHTHLVFDIADGRQLRFRDPRRFGSAVLFADPAALDRFFHRTGLGPEPFGLAADYWRQALAATRRSLKAVLLDQQIVAGVGNIYADEVLFQARLHPMARGCDLDQAAADRLRTAIAEVLERAIAGRGTTIRDYVGGDGLRGGFQVELSTYGQTGEPCPRCRTLIEEMRLAGRSSHFCPRCQPKPPRRRARKAQKKRQRKDKIEPGR